MPSVSNAGGSLTSAVVLTLLAWGVRWLRNELSRHKKEEAARQRERRSPGRFHAALSPAALRMLMETGPYPHVVFDVRDADETEPLPPELRGSLRLPHNMVAQALESPNDWAQFFHGIQYPQPHFMLVFVGSSKEQQLEAAAAASSVGFERTMTLSGSLMEFSQKVTLQQNLNYISRDAVAALVSPLNEASLIPTTRAVLVDVRRSDERLLYGAIRNSVHIPGANEFFSMNSFGPSSQSRD